MSYNVKGKWCFIVIDKENVIAFYGKKYAGTKHCRGRKPEQCFAEAEPPNKRRSG